MSNEAEPAVASMDVELASEVPAEDRGSLETSSQVKPYAGGKVVEQRERVSSRPLIPRPWIEASPAI